MLYVYSIVPESHYLPTTGISSLSVHDARPGVIASAGIRSLNVDFLILIIWLNIYCLELKTMQRYKKFSKFSVFIRFTLVFQPAVLICFITSSAIAASVAGHSTATGVAMFTKEGFRRESMKLSRKKESTISELSIPLFYVDYPIFSQLKYPLFMLWTFTSIPYLSRWTYLFQVVVFCLYKLRCRCFWLQFSKVP